MTTHSKTLLRYLIAAVWLLNGLVKIFNLVPRHRQIVARILGSEHSQILTVLIGFAEIAMAVWIVSNLFKKVNAIVQIVIVATMNIIEFMLAPDLLLWGRFNALFAFLFIALIYATTFKRPSICR